MRLELTSRDDWDPRNKWEALNSQSSSHFLYTDADPISNDLMSCKMLERAKFRQLLYTTPNSEKEIYQDCTFTTVKRVTSRECDSLTPEQLSIMWQIGLKTAKNTILATTHRCIRSPGILTRRFKTDKSQVRYRQLSRHHGIFYVDFMKVAIKLIRGYWRDAIL